MKNSLIWSGVAYVLSQAQTYIARKTVSKSQRKKLSVGNVVAMYRSGQLHLNIIELRRVGFDSHVHDAIIDAAAKFSS